ncbi:hypothetical protein C7H83_06695 [Tetragenococcus halophilus]|uniref:Uncharacterized protein n=1 Tax=Tetragenococcus halophilus TaxID=51669 RepID=A0A3G5FII6_TETHA|nr:hypothetical protein [Tetragenococcus halophilus]AYW50167.1 hypothetical protein C7H83_06695 [Tetragenococcus halophilus]NWN99269.1 hypothetical protein [Tetragenococcus halophilus]GBD63762.1 hypothetical protein TEHD23766T_1189 [Tetragenococcus halophilus subsp. flandriensis]
MNENDREFFESLNQYMDTGINDELIQALSTLSKVSYYLYTENINNGFNKDQSMEIVLEYVRGAMTN